MIPFAEFPNQMLEPIRGVFTDIDDTLTTDGKLSASAYASMELLQKNGILVIPITGRPAGWCDSIARIWPVDAVVGENGAFYFRYDPQARQMIRHFVDSEKDREENKARLRLIAREILTNVKGSAISADQAYRETDLAIDFCEDVSRLPRESIGKIVEIMSGFGMTAKVSSIHVNGWFGHYDKLTMTKICMQQCFGTDLVQNEAKFLFTGDSPNDGPMFEYFSNSVGVANVREFGDELNPPKYVTESRGGEGFSEVASAILAAKNILPRVT